MTETQAKLIEAAERIFADKGFHGTSVRDITNAASANIAAVNYHFGSKEGLFIEMIRYRIEPLNTLRMKLFDEATSENGDVPLSIRKIVEIIVKPLVDTFLSDTATPNTHFLRALGRGMSEETSLMLKLKNDVFAEIIERIQSELGRTLFDLPEHIRQICFTFLVSTINSIIQIRLRKTDCEERPTKDSETTYIVSFIAGGIDSIANDYRSTVL